MSENNNALSKLAHDYLAIDKDRPEICCIIGVSNWLPTCSRLTTCIAPAGNYYSLRAEHEKAVKYFRRATQLDRTYLAAWTLMGHEFVEMKNSHAAIEAYRKAVGKLTHLEAKVPLSGCRLNGRRGVDNLDVNKKDYRAWYGLAQAYELLGMHQYALYYYQHATALRYVFSYRTLPLVLTVRISPYDVRIWQAEGMCYEEMGR